MNDATRVPSAIDHLADDYLAALQRRDPFSATAMGTPDLDDQVTDYSPDAEDAWAGTVRDTLTRLDALPVRDDVDRVTAAAMRNRLGLLLELHDAGEMYGPLNVISTPPQDMRMVFDLAPVTTAANWADIATRMSRLSTSVDSYLTALRRRIDDGHAPPRRQVTSVIAQCAEITAPDGFFRAFIAGARPDEASPSSGLQADLERGAAAASDAYARLAQGLREDVLPRASEVDAVGRERYQLHSRYYVGATVDLEETYAWGVEELAAIEAEMAQVADQIVAAGSVDDAVAALDADPGRSKPTKEAFRDWMQQQSDQAVAALADTHFDIPTQIRKLECCIAPTTSGGVYYTPPSEDFSRPGRMWWAVPKDIDRFSTWRELTTVYHEGVPGHHLQLGQTLVRADLLNRWRRMGMFISGHGEGWALYAERLMADLGYLDDPGDRLGMLDGSAFRAMRVVVDIGTHCGFTAPDEVGGGVWNADKMWRYMLAHSRMQEGFLRFEHLRYLGWPGQAPSYKVGERLWRQIRDQVATQDGDRFDLKVFHRRALDLGAVPLDVLRDSLCRSH